MRTCCRCVHLESVLIALYLPGIFILSHCFSQAEAPCQQQHLIFMAVQFLKLSCCFSHHLIGWHSAYCYYFFAEIHPWVSLMCAPKYVFFSHRYPSQKGPGYPLAVFSPKTHKTSAVIQKAGRDGQKPYFPNITCSFPIWLAGLDLESDVFKLSQSLLHCCCWGWGGVLLVCLIPCCWKCLPQPPALHFWHQNQMSFSFWYGDIIH